MIDNRETLRLYRGIDVWRLVATPHGSPMTLKKWLDMWGVNDLPLTYSRDCPAEDVLLMVGRLNPNHEIELLVEDFDKQPA